MNSKEAKQILQHSIDRKLYHIELAKKDNSLDIIAVCNSSIELSQFLLNMIDENDKLKLENSILTKAIN